MVRRKGAAFAAGGLLFIVAVSIFNRTQPARTAQAVSNHAASESPLGADVQVLKDKAPDQAHAMVSVAYHFNNMWFAADAANWPLAEFYWNETRSHLRWAVRIIPVRKDSRGEEIKLQAILEAFENSPFSQLQAAIARKDHEAFVAAYRFTLETCYACHKAVEKPYLRPQIPVRPAEPTINFDPRVDWPR
jgi:hypothetical protein